MAPAVPKPSADRFDAPRAFALIRRELSYGQRPAGSPQLRRLAEVLRRAAAQRALRAGRRATRGLRNVVGTLPGRAPAIVVGAHYDSEYHPKGFVGANDSAAGTAAVVELARDLRSTSGREVRFVLFDGEEEGPGCPNARFDKCALRGSRAYVAAHPGEVGQMVLLDYIANQGVRLPREGSSDPALWARVRAAAERGRRRRRLPAPRSGDDLRRPHPLPARRHPRGRPHRLLLPLRRRAARTPSTSCRSRASTRWGRRCSRW